MTVLSVSERRRFDLPPAPVDAAEVLTLISHPLCPYVQRAVIALTEKRVPFQQVFIDLADKPDWFLALSPLGKTPVLKVGSRAIFESAVILEYLEETCPPPLHPEDPLLRAEHRGWIAFGSAVLDAIARLYSAADASSFGAATETLKQQFAVLDRRLGGGRYFDGPSFCLVDAAFGPVFRYFEVFDRIGDFGVFDNLAKLRAWREALALRPSVAGAVGEDYAERLWKFLEKRGSHISRLAAAGAV